MNALGKTIKERRLQKGMSFTHLAQVSGLSGQAIARLERGGSDVDVASLVQLADALGTSTESIISDASARDWERLLLVGVRNVGAELDATDRQVLRTASVEHALAILRTCRVDCIVVADDYRFSLDQLLNCGLKHSLQCKIVLLLQSNEQQPYPEHTPSCSPAHLTAVVEDVLARTTRGQVALLRRNRAQLTMLRQQLVVRQQRLLEQCKKTCLLGQELTRERELMLAKLGEINAHLTANAEQRPVHEPALTSKEQSDKLAALDRKIREVGARWSQKRRFIERRQLRLSTLSISATSP